MSLLKPSLSTLRTLRRFSVCSPIGIQSKSISNKLGFLSVRNESTTTHSPKIEQLVTDISQLTLLEVSELSTVLKERLNLPQAPIMPMGGFAAQAAEKEDEDAEGPKKVKSIFTVKLNKFDEKQKVALIKEVKNLMEGMNLVQAKKFVEGAPAVVKADIAKEEAEELKKALEKVGGVVEIE